MNDELRFFVTVKHIHLKSLFLCHSIREVNSFIFATFHGFKINSMPSLLFRKEFDVKVMFFV